MPNNNKSFEKIARKNLPDQIIGQIQVMIENGFLKPNDRLPSERDLAQMLGVSRLPLREALKSLQSTNVLEVRQGEGYYVRGVETLRLLEFFEEKAGLEHDMLGDLKEARIILEVAAIELACTRRSDEDIMCMRQNNENMKSAVAEGNEQVLQYSMDFHNSIFQAGGNRFLISIMACMASPLYEGRKKTLEANQQRYSLSVKEHDQMLEAIIAQDAETAKTLMRNHLQTSYYVE